MIEKVYGFFATFPVMAFLALLITIAATAVVSANDKSRDDGQERSKRLPGVTDKDRLSPKSQVNDGLLFGFCFKIAKLIWLVLVIISVLSGVLQAGIYFGLLPETF
jgi:uncharacterized membrane protein